MSIKDRIDEYRKKTALSQSDIKAIINGPNAYRAQKENNYFSDGLLIGGAVDVLLTQGVDEFYSEYCVLPYTSTTKSLAAIYYEAKNRLTKGEEDDEILNKALLEAAEALNYQPNWKPETLINHLCTEENREILRTLSYCEDKIRLTEEQSEIAFKVATSLSLHPHTTDYFHLKDGVRVETQVAIYFNYRGESCKALLDMIIFNDSDKDYESGLLKIPARSLLPIDIKTTGEYTTNFASAVKRYRYDIQGAWYTLACKKAFPGYNVLPFKFLVESTKAVGCPLVYIMSENDLHVGQWGYSKSYSYPVYGFEKGIDDFKWHSKNNEWNYSREIFESKGHIELDTYGREEQDS